MEQAIFLTFLPFCCPTEKPEITNTSVSENVHGFHIYIYIKMYYLKHLRWKVIAKKK